MKFGKKATSRAPSVTRFRLNKHIMNKKKYIEKIKQPHKGVDILTNLDVKSRLYSSTNLAISGKRRSVMDSNLFLSSERSVLLVRKGDAQLI
ncbi:hypothetical protein BpHYR1_016892 [Brachionus plicatilis]|uniref:Uncharacterized protein n=1 Tax=Brachionus plicatilis TaxID=10195 RepID=A0A3M7RFZ9_BRAPC|nr:hypothetical protein BpHYR1_016892 [Brachionus plicatilis]